MNQVHTSSNAEDCFIWRESAAALISGLRIKTAANTLLGLLQGFIETYRLNQVSGGQGLVYVKELNFQSPFTLEYSQSYLPGIHRDAHPVTGSEIKM